MITDNIGVYIHIPFCASRCYYCDFCSQATRDEEEMRKYTDALCREISESVKAWTDKPACDTLYFGGGTPSLLPIDCLERIISCVRLHFDVVPDAEITLEANPKTADYAKLCAMRRLGINRLSIGMQSAHDAELKALGRAHKFSDFKDFCHGAREAGFENISADVMYGIPEQTQESLEATLEALCGMSVEHISSYCLKIEEGTSFYRRRGELHLPDDDTVSDMYERMCDILARYGYAKYEISNFAKNGRESRHNLKYWEYNDYIGFGAGAHSFVHRERRENTQDIGEYIARVGIDVCRSAQRISESEAQSEYIMLGMRLARGVLRQELEVRFGPGVFEKFSERLKKFPSDFVDIDANGFKFTDKGMYVSNYILSEILDFS